MVSTGSTLHKERTYFFFPKLLRFPADLQCSLCDRKGVTDFTVPAHCVWKSVKESGLPSVLLKGALVFSTLALMECKLLKRDSDEASLRPQLRGSSNGLTLKEVSSSSQEWESRW